MIEGNHMGTNVNGSVALANGNGVGLASICMLNLGANDREGL